MTFREITYEEMKPHGKDYRLILHQGEKYYALINDKGEHLAACEIIEKKNEIHINCLHVPEQFRGHRYAQILIELILIEYSGFIATAQANDWSIKTFLRCGFAVLRMRQFKQWMAYYVRKG